MVLRTELPVYRDTYKLVLEIFISTKNFPKEYKYRLGRDMGLDVTSEKNRKQPFFFRSN
jgi:hypothetical protein